MKKFIWVLIYCVSFWGCGDDVSNSFEDLPTPPTSVVENKESIFNVGILHYNGTDEIYELSTSQDSWLFNDKLGDSTRHTIERNFYINKLIFAISPYHASCSNPKYVFKVDGKEVKTSEDKWGRIAVPLPDENAHTVEVSAPSCSNWHATFDIVPSDKPGKIFKHVDNFYLSFYPRAREFPFKNGSLFFTITPSVTAEYYAGDTTLSRCKLMDKKGDSLIVPVTFEKFKNRLGTLAFVNADSAKVTAFTDNRENFSFACALYYQSWKVPLKVDSVQYFQPVSVSFKKSIEEPFFGERNGRIDIVLGKELVSYFMVVRIKKRGTNEFLHLINYDYIQKEISTKPEWFFPTDESGNVLDIDSVYAYLLPFVAPSPEVYQSWDYLYTKYSWGCLDGKWCPETEDVKTDFDTSLAKIITKYDGFDSHTWMSAFAWKREIPLTRADTVGYKGEKLELIDERDGQKYKYMPIGGHFWMAENLKYESDSSSCYKDSANYCETYGRYYPYSEIDSVCPKGWRIPVKADFDTLMLHTGQDSVRSTLYYKSNIKLMSVTGWQTDVGEDEFGFSAYPYGESDGGAGYRAAYWTKSGVYGGSVYIFQILAGNGQVPHIDFSPEPTEFRSGQQRKRSIRCISDSTYPISSSSVPFSSSSIQYSTLTDERDNQTYKTVVIGNQEWMAENLNFETDSSWCYDTIPENCEKYGRLYQWHAVVDRSYAACGMRHECTVEEPAQGICPSGWHVPSAAEWDTLVAYTGMRTGGKEGSGRTLKSEEDWTGWTGLNRLGFNALPAGSRDYSMHEFYDLHESTAFWTSTAEKYGMSAQHYVFSNTSHDVLGWGAYKDSGFSLRCVKNKE